MFSCSTVNSNCAELSRCCSFSIKKPHSTWFQLVCVFSSFPHWPSQELLKPCRHSNPKWILKTEPKSKNHIWHFHYFYPVKLCTFGYRWQGCCFGGGFRDFYAIKSSTFHSDTLTTFMHYISWASHQSWKMKKHSSLSWLFSWLLSYWDEETPSPKQLKKKIIGSLLPISEG